MESIDKLTIELMMNRRQYKKYLANTDPEKYSENQEFIKKIKRNTRKMKEMTAAFLENPEEVSYNTTVNEMFTQYAKVLIQYIEMKEYDETDAGFTDDLDGEDVECLEEGEEEGEDSHVCSMSYKMKYKDHNP